jgi:hypothetical protein
MDQELLPAHGLIDCRRCWHSREGKKEFLSDDKRFKLVNDPAAWGSQNPLILVLGMTKGNTQSDAMMAQNDFDGIAYKNFRDRLTVVLNLVGLAKHVKTVSELIIAQEKNFAWGSVVRCSLTGFDKKHSRYSGESSKVLPAFSNPQMRDVVFNCFSAFLSKLPSRLKLVVLLGNSESYLRKMTSLVSQFYSDDFHSDPGDKLIAYKAGGKLWVHVGHPSRGNGYYNNFLEDPPTIGQGKKREIARRAIGHLNL